MQQKTMEISILFPKNWGYLYEKKAGWITEFDFLSYWMATFKSSLYLYLQRIFLHFSTQIWTFIFFFIWTRLFLEFLSALKQYFKLFECRCSTIEFAHEIDYSKVALGQHSWSPAKDETRKGTLNEHELWIQVYNRNSWSSSTLR